MSQFPVLPLLCQLFISSLTIRLYFFRACRHKTFSTSKVTAKTPAKEKIMEKPSERDGGKHSDDTYVKKKRAACSTNISRVQNFEAKASENKTQ